MEKSTNQPTHTPGPWVVDNVDEVWGGPAGMDCIAEVGGPIPAREANARLIAAAPDLLVAAIRCIELRDSMVRAGDDVDVIAKLVTDEIYADEALRIAIKKARGG